MFRGCPCVDTKILNCTYTHEAFKEGIKFTFKENASWGLDRAFTACAYCRTCFDKIKNFALLLNNNDIKLKLNNPD